MSKYVTDSGFKDWTPDRLPDLSGKLYLITGGNAGIGFEAGKMLAAAGGDIVVAGRSADKVAAAASDLDALGSRTASSVVVDLSRLASVRSAAEEVRERFPHIDGLINNAGIMQTPQVTTEDGFELQLATNHLGHFLWTGLLFDNVDAAAGRVVTVSSIAHKYGAMNFDDLMMTSNYSPSNAYTQSKLANLLFARELHRRLRASDSGVQSIACHPGYAATQLQSTGPRGLLNIFYKFLNAVMAQPAYNGAIPTALAAAGSEALAGAYYGPQKMGEARGRVSDAIVAPAAQDEVAGRRLWTESEALVGLEWSP